MKPKMNYEKEARQLFENNVKRWKREELGSHCGECVNKRIETKSNLVTVEFLQYILHEVNEQTGCSIEIIDAPVVLIERGNKSLIAEMTTRRLKTVYCPEVFQDLAEIHNIDPEKELQKSIKQAIVLEIVNELKMHDVSGEIVLCLYNLPIFTLIIYSPEDFTAHRGIMMRYAKILFPKDGEPVIF